MVWSFARDSKGELFELTDTPSFYSSYLSFSCSLEKSTLIFLPVFQKAYVLCYILFVNLSPSSAAVRMKEDKPNVFCPVLKSLKPNRWWSRCDVCFFCCDPTPTHPYISATIHITHLLHFEPLSTEERMIITLLISACAALFEWAGH